MTLVALVTGLGISQPGTWHTAFLSCISELSMVPAQMRFGYRMLARRAAFGVTAGVVSLDCA